jgi:hypothetical protein
MFIQFVLCSLFIWQIGLICWLLIRYWLNNKASVNGGIEEKQHIFKKALKKHPQGAVDISVDRQLVIEEADSAGIEIDNINKGKVKTQSEKLRKLRK